MSNIKLSENDFKVDENVVSLNSSGSGGVEEYISSMYNKEGYGLQPFSVYNYRVSHTLVNNFNYASNITINNQTGNVVKVAFTEAIEKNTSSNVNKEYFIEIPAHTYITNIRVDNIIKLQLINFKEEQDVISQSGEYIWITGYQYPDSN